MILCYILSGLSLFSVILLFLLVRKVIRHLDDLTVEVNALTELFKNLYLEATKGDK